VICLHVNKAIKSFIIVLKKTTFEVKKKKKKKKDKKRALPRFKLQTSQRKLCTHCLEAMEDLM
jgi:hypothetical protein